MSQKHPVSQPKEVRADQKGEANKASWEKAIYLTL